VPPGGVKALAGEEVWEGWGGDDYFFSSVSKSHRVSICVTWSGFE